MICSASLLALSCAAIGQTDESGEFSAFSAQQATQRIDFLPSYIELPDVNQGSLNTRYTRVFGSHHQVTAAAPLINPDLDSQESYSIGDVILGYNYTPARIISANPWVPAEIGTGVALSVPTGDADEGTGVGSWRLAPRFGFVAPLGSNAAVTPTVQYVFSFLEQDDVSEVRTFRIAAPVTYVTLRTFWIQWSPAYSYDLELDEGGLANALLVGKLFHRNFALSLQYTTGPLYAATPIGTITDDADVWTLGVHVPFSYRQ